MRTLKLQMQVSVDGFVAGPEGQLDWMTWTWDPALADFVNQLTDSIDTILLGRKMTDGFNSHWEAAVQNPEDPSQAFAKKMVDARKIVFSRSQTTVKGINTTITNENVVDVVNRLKAEAGKDIVVYGGANFVSSLIENNLIDDLYLFVNPTAIGEGLRIFHQRTPLKLAGSVAYDCGIVVNHYTRPQ
jgi:dihydrofolate reductase